MTTALSLSPHQFLIPRFLPPLPSQPPPPPVPAHDKHKEQQQKPPLSFLFSPPVSLSSSVFLFPSLSRSIGREGTERQQLLWQLLVSAIDKMIRRLRCPANI